MTARLRITGLHRRYGRRRAVDGLELTLPAGELVCLIGPNGAGKTTTLRLIAGHQMPDEGQIAIDGVDITGDPDTARAVCALTPQDLALHQHLTPEETLQLHGQLRGLQGDDLTDRINRWLAAAHLEDVRHRYVRELSGGMKRKLAMGCALLAPLPLVLLDEAFVGLDPESTRSLERELVRARSAGTTILLSSHLLDMVHRIADRVVMMRAGRVQAHWDRPQLDAALAAHGGDLTDLYLDQLGGELAPGGTPLQEG